MVIYKKNVVSFLLNVGSLTYPTLTNNMYIKCHRTFIWCLVIVVIEGSTISNNSEMTQTGNITSKENSTWDEDPNRWDFEIEIIEPQPLNLSEALPADTPHSCLLYTSPSPRDATLSRMPASA